MTVSFPGVSAAQNASAGDVVFQTFCALCHTTGEGDSNGIGPNLFGIVNSTAGTRPGFNYSSAVADSGIKWTPPALEDWITDPNAKIPGNRMPFDGLSKKSDRADVVAYLKTLK